MLFINMEKVYNNVKYFNFFDNGKKGISKKHINILQDMYIKVIANVMTCVSASCLLMIVFLVNKTRERLNSK